MKWDTELDTAILEADCRVFPFKGKKRGSGDVRYFVHIHIQIKSTGKDTTLETIESGNFADLLLQLYDKLKNPIPPWTALKMKQAVDASVVNAADCNIRKVEPLEDSEFKRLAEVCRSIERTPKK